MGAGSPPTVHVMLNVKPSEKYCDGGNRYTLGGSRTKAYGSPLREVINGLSISWVPSTLLLIEKLGYPITSNDVAL